MRIAFLLGLTLSVFAQAQTPAPAKPTTPAASPAKPVTTPAPSVVKPAVAPAAGVSTPAAGVPAATAPKPVVAAPKKPTIADVREWMDKAEKHLLDLSIDSSRIEWIAATYITDDT